MRHVAKLLGFIFVLEVNGALVAYEPFAYSGSLSDGTASSAVGFSGSWSCGTAPSIVTGLSYTGLDTTEQSVRSTSGRQTTELAAPLSSGTAWISFLFNVTGNNGGNSSGIFLANGGTGLFLGYGLQPISGTEGALALGSINTTGTAIKLPAMIDTSFRGTYGETPYLIAIKVDFDTDSTNDTVAVYINPTVGEATPGVAATYMVTSFDVGTITGVGMQNSGGGHPIIVDEIRVGDSYEDVAGGEEVVVPLRPVITGLDPTSGLTNGGAVVTISGSNFLSGATVRFGDGEGMNVSVISSNQISAITPPQIPGVVNVVVVNTNGLSATNYYGFTYEEPPPPPLPAPELVPGSMVVTASNMNFIWAGSAHSTSVLMSSTNLADEAGWEPVVTNRFGEDARATNQIMMHADDAQRFFGLSQPTAIVAVDPPSDVLSIPSGSESAIGLSWTASASDGVIGYRIQYGVSGEELDQQVEVGLVTSVFIFGLEAGITYTIEVTALTESGASQEAVSLTAQTGISEQVINLFNADTPLEAPTQVARADALYTYFADRVRDRHARESQFKQYEHYLTWYWEQRTGQMEIIDRIPMGGSNITFNYTTLAKLNPAEFRAFYLGRNTVAEYHFNAKAELVSTNPSAIPGETDYNYTVTIPHNLRENRAFQVGDLMEIEISFFLLNPRNGRNNYYGTTLLYVVGEGLVPWQGHGYNLDSSPIPTNGWLGGKTTVHYNYSDEPKHAFKQMATNISPTNGQPFMLGRRLHHTDFGTGTHSEPNNPIFSEQVGKLGSVFVNRSCVACHVNNGRSLPADEGIAFSQSVVKVGSDALGAAHPVLGSVMQPASTTGSGEGTVSIASYTYINGRYGDGSPYELRKPVYAFSGEALEYYSVRNAPPLMGLGLLEAIAEEDVLALADPGDEDQDGISGRAQQIVDPETGYTRLGRFGYKAANARLRHHIASALNNDMGITTSVFPALDGETAAVGDPEISDEELDLMMRYVALLGMQARRNLDDAQALQGEVLFRSAGCVDCHTPSFTTSSYHPLRELNSQVIRPYSDLLLHDMGAGLADTMGEKSATGSEWRTTPLWNIGHTAGVNEQGEAYLHDGRARTLAEAILWHGGEAEASKEAFRLMSAQDRAALIAFLESL
jgi:CxxC motif-containing protein (DUF1111 family)